MPAAIERPVIIFLRVRFIPTNLAGDESMFWKIVLVLGILGLLLGFAVTGVSVALPIATEGRASWDQSPQPSCEEEGAVKLLPPHALVCHESEPPGRFRRSLFKRLEGHIRQCGIAAV